MSLYSTKEKRKFYLRNRQGIFIIGVHLCDSPRNNVHFVDFEYTTTFI